MQIQNPRVRTIAAMRGCRWVVSLVVGGVALVHGTLGHSPAHAQCEMAKFVASDGSSRDMFGEAVAVSDDVAVVGAGLDDDGGMNTGSAYVYRFDGAGWVLDGKLLANDRAPSDHFGRAVAVSGNAILVGAHGDDDNGIDSGSAYVFRYNGLAWMQEQKLTAADGTSSDAFGSAVAISDDVAVIGAWGDAENGGKSGSAYVFRYNGSVWVQESKLLPAVGAAYEYFGWSVAVSGDAVLVGVWGDSTLGSLAGAVYVFRHSGLTWAQEMKLQASDWSDQAFFGWSVALSGDAAAIGAWGDADNGTDAGAVYVFLDTGSGWVEQAKLTVDDGMPNDSFGRAVAVSGNTVVAGALGDGDNGDESGSVSVFQNAGSGWASVGKLLAHDGAAGDRFGEAVAVSNGRLMIGTPKDDDKGSDAGAAYGFSLTAADCNDNGFCDSRDIDDGTSTDTNGNGVPDECEGYGDFDSDTDVDLADFGHFQTCFNGPNRPPAMTGCGNADSDIDGDVDLVDFFAFQACFNGPNRPLACH
ncbi:MAG: FG-GAP repeat protein [Phycisphaerae bacterium]|nr:FG-GAP repeat protein [Phycisphaerae bacterium]